MHLCPHPQVHLGESRWVRGSGQATLGLPGAVWRRGPASSPLPTLATCPGSSLKPLSLSSLAGTLPINRYTAPLWAWRGDVGPSEGARFPVTCEHPSSGQSGGLTCATSPHRELLCIPLLQVEEAAHLGTGLGSSPPPHTALVQPTTCTAAQAVLLGSEDTLLLREGRFSQGTGTPPGLGAVTFLFVLGWRWCLPSASLPPQQSLASGCSGPSSVQGLRVGHTS